MRDLSPSGKSEDGITQVVGVVVGHKENCAALYGGGLLQVTTKTKEHFAADDVDVARGCRVTKDAPGAEEC